MINISFSDYSDIHNCIADVLAKKNFCNKNQVCCFDCPCYCIKGIPCSLFFLVEDLYLNGMFNHITALFTFLNSITK